MAHSLLFKSCTIGFESCLSGPICAPTHFLLARPKFEYYQHNFSQSLHGLKIPREPRNTYRAVVNHSDILVHQWVRALSRSLSLCSKLLPCRLVRCQNLMNLYNWEESRDCMMENSFVDIVPTVPKDRILIISTL